MYPTEEMYNAHLGWNFWIHFATVSFYSSANGLAHPKAPNAFALAITIYNTVCAISKKKKNLGLKAYGEKRWVLIDDKHVQTFLYYALQIIGLLWSALTKDSMI